MILSWEVLVSFNPERSVPASRGLATSSLMHLIGTETNLMMWVFLLTLIGYSPQFSTSFWKCVGWFLGSFGGH
jgi:hypothetical protein